MASTFGGDVTIAEEIGSSAPINQGVVDNSLSVALESTGSMFDVASDVISGKKEDKKVNLANSFRLQQLKEAEAVQQGASSAFATARMNKNLQEAIHANPGVDAKVFTDVMKELQGITGGTKIVTDGGTNQEQIVRDRNNAMVTNNLIGSNATQAEFDQLSLDLRNATTAQKVYEEKTRELELRSKTLAVGSAERTALNAEGEQSERELIQASMPAASSQYQTTLKKILSGELDNGNPKEQQIEEFHTQWLLENAAQLKYIKGDERKMYEAPFDRMKEVALKQSSGEYDLNKAEAAYKKAMALTKWELVQDPTVRRMVAGSDLFGADSIVGVMAKANQSDQFNKAMGTFLGGAVSGGDVTTFSDDKEQQRVADEAVAGLSKAIVNGESEDAKDAWVNYHNQLTDTAGKIVRDPKRAALVAKNIASDDWFKTSKLVDRNQLELGPLSDILQAHYLSEVDGLIRSQFAEAGVLRGKVDEKGMPIRDAASQVIATRWVGEGMEFYSLTPENPAVRNKVRELNRTLKPIINDRVRAQAHLAGTQSYEKVWDGVQEGLMDPDSLLKPAGGDEGDDLSLSDFDSPTSALNSSMSSGGFVGNGDWSSATTPTEVAASFVGFNETEHEKVLSSFIKKTVGVNLSPKDTAWCAAFVNGALGATGVEGTGKLNARSFMEWGKETTSPTQGDIAVFTRGNPNGWQGHVGFYVGPSDKKGYVRVLGGNQGNKVSIRDYPESELLGYRSGT